MREGQGRTKVNWGQDKEKEKEVRGKRGEGVGKHNPGSYRLEA